MAEDKNREAVGSGDWRLHATARVAGVFWRAGGWSVSWGRPSLRRTHRRRLRSEDAGEDLQTHAAAENGSVSICRRAEDQRARSMDQAEADCRSEVLGMDCRPAHAPTNLPWFARGQKAGGMPVRS